MFVLLVRTLLSTLDDPMRPRSRLVHTAVAPLVFAVITALAFGSLAVGSPVSAAPSGDRRSELADQIGEASRAEAAAVAELQAIRDRKAAIDAKVAELDVQLSTAEATLAPLAAEAERLDGLYSTLVAEVNRIQAELDAATIEFNDEAAGLYRSARRGATYDVVLSARPGNVVKQQKYLDQVTAQQRRVVRRISRLRADLEEQRRALEDQKAKADAAQTAAQAARDQVAGLRAEVEPARAEAAAQEGQEQALVASIQSQKGAYEAELAALSATSDSISARLRALGTTPGSVGPCGARPVPGPISSGFGSRYHPILHYTRMHTGADFSASSGTPIASCRAGTVVIAGSQGGYGNAVVIDHGGGMGTVYAHQSRIAVSVGQRVDAGEIVGYVGSTGMSTGPHLHFEVRLSGNPVNPASYL